MCEVEVLLPNKVLRALERMSKSEGRTLEELISEAVLKWLNVADPDVKAELHLRLCEKYLREAEDFLAKRNYVQASEKAWGVASQIVKAVAARRGAELRSHRDLWEFTTKLDEEHPEWGLLDKFHVANSLHTNFYGNWLTGEAVARGIEAIKIFVDKLKGLYSSE